MGIIPDCHLLDGVFAIPHYCSCRDNLSTSQPLVKMTIFPRLARLGILQFTGSARCEAWCQLVRAMLVGLPPPLCRCKASAAKRQPAMQQPGPGRGVRQTLPLASAVSTAALQGSSSGFAADAWLPPWLKATREEGSLASPKPPSVCRGCTAGWYGGTEVLGAVVGGGRLRSTILGQLNRMQRRNSSQQEDRKAGKQETRRAEQRTIQ